MTLFTQQSDAGYILLLVFNIANSSSCYSSYYTTNTILTVHSFLLV